MKSLADYSLTDESVQRCPFPYYAAMRSSDPIHLDPRLGYYIVSRYEDALAVAQNPEAFSSSVEVLFRKTFKPTAQRLLDDAGVKVLDTFISNDPPLATEFHRAGVSLLTPKKVSDLRPQASTLAHRIIDGLAGRREVEISKEFSQPFVSTMVANQYELPDADIETFKAWTECTGQLAKIGTTEDEEVAAIKKMVQLMHYLIPHVRKARLSGKPGTVIHTVATIKRNDGSEFSELERCWMAFLAFTGGNNTTSQMISIDTARLATDPALQAELRANPGKIEAFIEEMLRLQGVSQNIARRATRDVEINGTLIPKGAIVLISVGSANRDESQWGPNAAEVQLDRSGLKRHLAFGSGPHTCVGVHFARMLLQVGLGALLERTRSIRLADTATAPEFVPLPFHRGLGPFRVVLDGIQARGS